MLAPEAILALRTVRWVVIAPARPIASAVVNSTRSTKPCPLVFPGNRVRTFAIATAGASAIPRSGPDFLQIPGDAVPSRHRNVRTLRHDRSHGAILSERPRLPRDLRQVRGEGFPGRAPPRWPERGFDRDCMGWPAFVSAFAWRAGRGAPGPDRIADLHNGRRSSYGRPSLETHSSSTRPAGFCEPAGSPESPDRDSPTSFYIVCPCLIQFR